MPKIMPKNRDFIPANRIRELRQAHGLKLRQIAEQIGTTPTHINRLERGERDLTLAWMRAIARVLDVAPADLLLPVDGGLDARERDIIGIIRHAPDNGRAAIFAVVESQRMRGDLESLSLPPTSPRT